MRISLTETELTFNYNLDCLSNEKAVCRCGASNCSGFIGERPKSVNTKNGNNTDNKENKTSKAKNNDTKSNNEAKKRQQQTQQQQQQQQKQQQQNMPKLSDKLSAKAEAKQRRYSLPIIPKSKSKPT